ncbi:MAG: flagellar biosynthetic protein FliR [bacterium]
MDTLWITELQLLHFLFIFFRITGILFTAPLFGEKLIPKQLRIGLALILTVILIPVIQLNPRTASPGFILAIPLILSELLIGLILGFAANLLFTGVQLSGQLVGYQMGFAVANVLDPISGSQVSLFAQFETLSALMIFLCVNAHHLFIKAIVSSFRLIPPCEFHPQGGMVEKIMTMAGHMFVLAVQIGGPTIAVLIFVNVFFALMARTVPEINIFIVAMPLGIAVGLFVLGTSMPFFANLLIKTFHNLGHDLMVLMKGM